MASIFQNAVKYVGDTLKQVVTPDTLKDYRHANQLFVGGNFRLVPKTGFLFHVFFDINPAIANSRVWDTRPKLELGLMVKSTDLPKYRVDTKLLNSYNRPNIIQSKIKFEQIQMAFHDDSANVVRDFWYDYMRYYYRDSDYTENTYRLNYKYINDKQIFPFGYSPRHPTIQIDEIQNYLTSIRIYSLHQKRFTEYTLLHPVITTFRHGSHAYENTTNLLENTMVIEYENVLYNQGSVSQGTVQGFAELNYDKSPSPLKLAGGARSIFGVGGLVDTAGEVLEDFNNGNFGSAIFKAARGINSARSMNLKKAAVSEITSIYTQEASRAITGQIARTLDPGAARTPITVSTLSSIDGAGAAKYSGIQPATSVAALAGAAILLNSTPVTNKVKVNPTNQANYSRPPTNYNPKFPTLPGYTAASAAQAGTLTLNDSAPNSTVTNQITLDLPAQRRALSNQVVSLDRKLDQAARDIGQAEQAQASAATGVTMWTNKYNTLLASPSPGVEVLLNQALVRIQELQTQQQAAAATIVTRRADVTSYLQERNQVSQQLQGLGG